MWMFLGCKVWVFVRCGRQRDFKDPLSENNVLMTRVYSGFVPAAPLQLDLGDVEIGDTRGKGMSPAAVALSRPESLALVAAHPFQTRGAGPQPSLARHHLLSGSSVPAPRPAPASLPRRDGSTGAGCPAASAAELSAGARRAASEQASVSSSRPRSRCCRPPGACLPTCPPTARRGSDMLLLALPSAPGQGQGRPAGGPRRGRSPSWSPAWICCWALAGCQAAWAEDLPSPSSRALPPCQEVSSTWSLTPS